MCFSVWLSWYPYFDIIFVSIILMHILFHHWNNTAEEDGYITLTYDTEALSTPPKEVKKKMVRNVRKYSDIVKLHCIHIIPLYASVILILFWWYAYLLFLAYTWIDKSYDSDDLLLNQMAIQRNTEVNDEGGNAEDEEEDKCL